MDFLTALEPHLMEIIGAIFTALIAFVAQQIRAYLGIEIERRHREALHEALMSGARAAFQDGPDAGIELLTSRAIEHARRSVPDAIAALVPGDGVLDRIARRRVSDVLDRLGAPR